MSQLLSSSFPHSHFEVPGSRNNPRAALQDYPGCQMLRDAYRRIHKIPNKTPLSMLYEYASRLNLEVGQTRVVQSCHRRDKVSTFICLQTSV